MSAAAPGGKASAGAVFGERLSLRWRPFSFALPTPLHTAAGDLPHRRGWLLRLETARGSCGWGEASPLAFGCAAAKALESCAMALGQLGTSARRDELERQLPALPPPLAFALGAALAEADGWVGSAAGGWLPAPPSAWLLPAGEAAIVAAQGLLHTRPAPGALPLTFKWKVGVHPAGREQAWCGEILRLLPLGSRLRLDANGTWDRSTAWQWAERLQGERRLEWLEQPLDPAIPAADHEGIEALARHVPVALDESLRQRPELRRSWPGWQVRRPSQEGDPRVLLREFQRGRPRWIVSTSFETGIGRRWLAHLAALQLAGPTPTAPGLAPGWAPPGDLAAEAPETVWRAAWAG